MELTVAKPNCPRCENTSFALSRISVKDARYDYQAISCSSCGAVVSVLDIYAVGPLLEEKAGSLTEQIQRVEHSLARIEQTVRQIKRQ